MSDWAGTGTAASGGAVIGAWQGARLELSIRPIEEPVSLADAKAHLRVIGTDDDTYISALITAARSYAEQAQGRQLCTAEWRLYLPKFPLLFLSLEPTPLRSVTSIVYYDENNALQTLSSDVYEARKYSAHAGVAPADGESWPGTYPRPDAVRVTFSAGYGDAADVPPTTKQAIMMLAAYWYAQREAATDKQLSEAPLAVQTLINMDRVEW